MASYQSTAEIAWDAQLDRTFFPSPDAWEDQVLYFLMLDRFSDGREHGFIDNDGNAVDEGETPSYSPADADSAIATPEETARWRRSGVDWVGGTLRGLASKLGYLKRLGVTAVWISPVFKQVAFDTTYHGYGIQNFLDVDPHFGTREELRDLVRQAHEMGIYVILDIILNHTGDVFAYDADRYRTRDPRSGQWYIDPRWDGNRYDVKGYRSASGEPVIPFGPVDTTEHPEAWPDGAVWPVELQPAESFTRQGYISNWEHDPEYRAADFMSLKDIHLGYGSVDTYAPSPALRALIDIYRYWIAYTDVDGYRIDTVKHMDPGATRYFAQSIHEFTQRIGKNRFYLIGEITGGRTRAFATLEITGLDAALGINEIPDKLEYLVKGYRHAHEYFDLFRNSLLVNKESNLWFRNKVVTMYDDHDQVRKGAYKARFCAGSPHNANLALNVLALNATTMGIPCVYYGSEQALDGEGDSDRFLREAMFGGEFGPFRTRHRHVFDESSWVYREFAKVLKLRREHIALRRGRQFLREISADGQFFGEPEMIGGEIRSVVPWSRIFDGQEMLLAINTDAVAARSTWVLVDSRLHPPGSAFHCLYSRDEGQIGQSLAVEEMANGGSAVFMTVPPAGFVLFE